MTGSRQIWRAAAALVVGCTVVGATRGLAAEETAEPAAEARPMASLRTRHGIELVRIPAGEFRLGCDEAERKWATDLGMGRSDRVDNVGDAPKQTRIVGEFWLGRTEVTVAQWRAFVEDTGHITDAEEQGECIGINLETQAAGLVPKASWRDPHFGFPIDDSHPATCLSWRDAMLFCEWLNKHERALLPEGYEFRLPTEAEWEYACRAGSSGRFWWGNSTAEGKGRLNAASDDPLSPTTAIVRIQRFQWSDGFAWTAPVDSFGERGRNDFGLADMLGNVAEWCLDAFDPAGPHEAAWLAQERKRVIRGGSFFSPPGEARCASREGWVLRMPRFDVGFRLCAGKSPESVGVAVTEQEMMERTVKDALRFADEAQKRMEELKANPPQFDLLRNGAMPRFNPTFNPFEDPAEKAKRERDANLQREKAAREVGQALWRRKPADARPSAPAAEP